MPSRAVVAVRSLLFVAFAASACASTGDPGFRTLPGCPGFQIDQTQITVGAAGDTIFLTNNKQSWIRFAPGAVPAGTSFNVSYVNDEHGRKTAGFGFTPAVAEFPEPVQLRTSYNGCPEILQNHDQRLHIVMKDANGDFVSIGGAKSKQQHYVEVYVPHFTDFAIAM